LDAAAVQADVLPAALRSAGDAVANVRFTCATCLGALGLLVEDRGPVVEALAALGDGPRGHRPRKAPRRFPRPGCRTRAVARLQTRAVAQRPCDTASSPPAPPAAVRQNFDGIFRNLTLRILKPLCYHAGDDADKDVRDFAEKARAGLP